MRVHEYIPKKDPKRAIGVICILISAAVGFFAFPAIFKGMPLAWLFQITAVICLMWAIFIYSRYVIKNVIYSLEQDEESGEVDFTVTEIIKSGTGSARGKITVCRFALSGIEELEVFEPGRKEDEERKKKFTKQAKKEGRKIFDYCPWLSNDVTCGLFVTEYGEKLFIKLTPDRALLNAFRDALEKNLDTSKSG